jgi:hypothetical protein
MDQRVENVKRITAGLSLFILAFLLAFTIRFFDLGRNFLTDGEAASALQALGIAQGSRPLIGSQPGYVLFTGGLFAIFGANEITARFWPALVGSLIVAVPYLFRRRLGNAAAIILAFSLALGPGLIAISRQADGLVFAVVFTLLALGFWDRHFPIPAGICAGLALLGGPGFWFSLPVLAIAILWSMVIDRRTNDSEETSGQKINVDATELRSLLIWTGITLAGAGTMFFFAPSGLGGVAASLISYVSGWVHGSGVTLVEIGVALVAYELMALLLGLWGIVASWKEHNPIDAFLQRWFLLELVFVLLYPSRQVTYLVWVTIPLWVLAARQLVRLFHRIEGDWKIICGYTALAFALMVFIWMNCVYVAINSASAQEVQTRGLVVLIAGVMVVMLLLLVRWGWSSTEAVTGFSAALSMMLVIFTVAGAFNASGLGRRPDTELYRAGGDNGSSAAIAEGDLLTQTLRDFCQMRGIDRNPITVQVENLDLPSLQWALRDFTNVNFTRQVSSDAQPAMIITGAENKPAQTTDYTGQGFVWEQQPAWSSLLPFDWAKWATSREITVEKTSLILWVRSDLFPGGGTTTTDVVQ